MEGPSYCPRNSLTQELLWVFGAARNWSHLDDKLLPHLVRNVGNEEILGDLLSEEENMVLNLE